MSWPLVAVALLAATPSWAVPFAVKYATNTTAQWNSAEWTDITIADDSQMTVSGPAGCAGTFVSNSMWNGEISYSNRVNGTNFWLYKAANVDVWYITTNRTVNAPTIARWSMLSAASTPYGGYGPAGVRPPNAAPYLPTTYAGIATNAFAFTTNAAAGGPTDADTVIIGTDIALGRTQATVVVDGGTYSVKNVILGFDSSGNATHSEIGTLVITNGATLNIVNDLNLGGNIADRYNDTMRTGIGILQQATGTTLNIGRDLYVTRSTCTVASARTVTVGRNVTLGNAYNTGAPYAIQGMTIDGVTLAVPGYFIYCANIRQTTMLRMTNNAVLNIGGDFRSGPVANDTLVLNLDVQPGCQINITSNFIYQAASTVYNPAAFQIGGGLTICNGGAGGGIPAVALLTQNGGTSTVNFITIADAVDSRGEYVMTNGAVLAVRRPASGTVQNSICGNNSNAGRSNGARLRLGDATTPGIIRMDESGGGSGKLDLVIRLSTRSSTTGMAYNSYGDLTGWGRVDLNGTLTMHGRVIADGYGNSRDLIMTNFVTVTQNDAHVGFPLYGWMDCFTNKSGWYAVNGGRLTLPPLTVSSGTSTQRWGDTINDFVITSNDLANSAMVIWSNVTGGSASISLTSTNRGDSHVLYPATVIGLWNVDGSALQLGGGTASFTFRYDHQAAEAKGLTESNLKVWQYTTGWTDITAGAVNTTDKTITAQPTRTFSLFAVSTEIPGRIPAVLGTVLKIQ